MANEKVEEIFDISSIQSVEELHKHRDKIINEFAKAYLAETKLLPSEIELVCREIRSEKSIETIYEFRRKNENRG